MHFRVSLRHMPGKTNKMVQKRFRLTGKGKLMRKHAATNHFNARRTRDNMRAKRHTFQFSGVYAKAVKQYLN